MSESTSRCRKSARLSKWIAIACAMLFLCLVMVPSRVPAESGFTLTAPATGPRSKSGLTLSLDTTWVEGYGYRPVRVQVKSAKASSADRVLTIVLKTNERYYWSHGPMAVMQDFDLPAGATTASTTVAVPQYSEWYQVSWDLMVDGELIGDLSSESPMWGSNSGLTNSTPRILVAVDAPKERNQLKALTDWSGTYSGMPVRDLKGMIRKNRLFVTQNPMTGPTAISAANVMELGVAEMPDRWILYSSLDIVCLNAQQVDTLKSQHPKRWEALRSWVLAGGNLWIYDVGKAWERLPAVEEALRIENDSDLAADALVKRGWRRPTGKEPLIEIDNIYSEDEGVIYDRFGNQVAVGSLDKDEEVEAAIKKMNRDPKKPTFALRDMQFGRVVVLSSDTPFASAGDPMSWVLGTVGKQRYQWNRRHGLVPNEENPSYWNFLIPGVGFAPVNAFRVLITLFVLGIGPINYVLLRRRKRLQWLILTVPLGAVVVTLCLFGYALVADGLSVRLRARSLTQLDQRTGEETSWTRLSYYAGLAPNDGMSFDEETVVLPIIPNDSNNYSYRNRTILQEREVQWYDGQQLTYGWLKSRTPTQYLTVRSSQSERKLEINQRDGAISIRNELGVPIEELFLMDSEGEIHTGGRVELGAKMSLKQEDSQAASKRLASLMKNNQAKTPKEIRRYITEYDGSYYGSMSEADYGETRIEQSRLERSMVALSLPIPSKSEAEGSKPLNSKSEKMWRPRTYVVITREMPAGGRGVADAEEESSFHIIVGRW